MWINLSREEADLVQAALDMFSQHVPEARTLAARIADDVADRASPDNLPYVQAAQRLHHQDGEVEVEVGPDNECLVSMSEDGGAYVMAWVWVSEFEAANPPPDYDFTEPAPMGEKS